MYYKFMDSSSNLFLINSKDREVRFRIKPDSFIDSWYVSDKDFYTQDFIVDGQTITFALPW